MKPQKNRGLSTRHSVYIVSLENVIQTASEISRSLVPRAACGVGSHNLRLFTTGRKEAKQMRTPTLDSHNSLENQRRGWAV
jgi:hypothetical protein